MFKKLFLSIIPVLALVSGTVSESLNTRDTTCPYKAFHKQDKYKVAMLVYDDFAALDLLGPGEILGVYPEKFDMHVIGTKPNSISKASGFDIYNDMSISQANALKDEDAFDIVVIPGGQETTQEFMNNTELMGQFKQLSNRAKIVFSVCTGSLILAKAGFLDNKCATTNKFDYKMRTPQHPTVNWQPKARWVHSGKYLTSSGIAAGMDATFYLVTELISKKEAERGANALEYTPHWDSKDDPFSKEYLLAN